MLPHPQPPVVHSPLLCLADVEREIVVLTACCQVTDLLSIVRLLAVSDEVQNGCVVSKLGKEVCAVCCSTVMGEREEQEGAEQASPGLVITVEEVRSQFLCVWSPHQNDSSPQKGG